MEGNAGNGRSYRHITFTTRDGVARIGLARPPVNALTRELLQELLAALRQAADDSSARVVLLASDVPGRFSAGLDLPLLLRATPEETRATLLDLYPGLADAQHALGKPSVAVVSGTARGGGMTLAISCDIIIAASEATLGYPEIDLGLPPALHFAHLPRIVGRHRAFELLFTGRTFTAAEGQALGLVSRIAPAAELEAAAMALAAELAAKPAAGVARARAAFMRQNDLDYRRSVAVAVEDFCNAFATPEARAALEAFARRKGKL
ncbi:enoyl-CoA hydratase/isomerase family protein [Camelimonas abortus]|uniref:Enoyl-CoA hydratase/isomerase family protein n=1 Tax=Camelimonas abortus TaxID=1017184 RepID=A0ABV7LEC2_9HYPH